MRTGKMVAIGCLVLGVLFYLGSVAGLLWANPTPVADVGVISTAGIFVLFGLVGLMLKERPAAP
jgi:hypothetical protein